MLALRQGAADKSEPDAVRPPGTLLSCLGCVSTGHSRGAPRTWTETEQQSPINEHKTLQLDFIFTHFNVKYNPSR